MSTISQEHFLYPFAERSISNPNGKCCAILERGNLVEYSNLEMYNLAIEYAKRILSIKTNFGEVIPIILTTGIDLYAAFIGVSIAGCVPTIFPPYNKKQDINIYKKSMSELFKRISVRNIISSRSILNSEMYYENIIFKEDFASNCIGLNDIIYPFYKKIAFLQHSSGTTGSKKGVMISHDNILRHANTYADCIGLVDGDVIASWLPIYHDMGLITSFLMPIIKGNRFVTMDPVEWSMRPDRFLQIVTSTKAAFAWFPDFAFNHTVSMSRATDIDLSSIKKIINCSEPCRKSSIDKFYQRFSQFGLSNDALHASYAMAENVFCVTQTKRSTYPVCDYSDDVAYVSSGRPMDGVGVYIKDEFGDFVENSDVGEIWISGLSLTDGYYLMPELTKERFIEDVYRTGDLGFMRDGELYVVGRNDDVLNINGKKIVAHDIENIISNIEGVISGRCFAFSVYEISRSRNGLGILFEHNLETDLEIENLKKLILKNVASISNIAISELYAVERGFIVKSTSGKISRKLNIEKMLSHFHSGF